MILIKIYSVINVPTSLLTIILLNDRLFVQQNSLFISIPNAFDL
jgi:hypothetical protein